MKLSEPKLKNDELRSLWLCASWI